jgi:Domain of unknown function (DUF4430)
MKKAVLVLSMSMALLCGAVAPIAVAAAATGPVVTVQVKTLTKTLLKPTKARGSKGWITKGHTPPGKCSASSAAGALNNATHGRWSATYYASVGGIFIDSILGVKPPSKNDYWEILVNGHVATVGACQIKLKPGERLLFKVAKG